MDAGANSSANVDFKVYEGNFSSKQLPIKITMKVDGTQLTVQATGQPAFPLEYMGDDKFSFEMGGIELTYSKDKKTLELSQGGQKFDFTKD